MCRFTVADANRKATIYIDGKVLADVVIPATHAKADENGFFNMEYPIPAEWLLDAEGSGQRCGGTVSREC